MVLHYGSPHCLSPFFDVERLMNIHAVSDHWYAVKNSYFLYKKIQIRPCLALPNISHDTSMNSVEMGNEKADMTTSF